MDILGIFEKCCFATFIYDLGLAKVSAFAGRSQICPSSIYHEDDLFALTRLFFGLKIDISVVNQEWSCQSLQLAETSFACNMRVKETLPIRSFKNRDSIVAERSKYQQNIIKNYYDNRETISLQRAQEIVTELYLSEGKKRQKYWKTLEGHLLKLEVKQQVIDHLVSQDDPQLAAKLLTKLGKSL